MERSGRFLHMNLNSIVLMIPNLTYVFLLFSQFPEEITFAGADRLPDGHARSGHTVQGQVS